MVSKGIRKKKKKVNNFDLPFSNFFSLSYSIVVLYVLLCVCVCLGGGGEVMEWKFYLIIYFIFVPLCCTVHRMRDIFLFFFCSFLHGSSLFIYYFSFLHTVWTSRHLKYEFME